MKLKALYSLRYVSLKVKLCVLTVLLLGIVMGFVGYTVIRRQRETLFLQMEGTGRFLVKNLAKNVIGPLLEGDSLSLSNLISSLEARDQVRDNPARFTKEEYEKFLTHFFLEDKAHLFAPYLVIKGSNIYIQVEQIPNMLFQTVSTDVVEDILSIVGTLETQQQYETFFEQYPWTRSLIEPLIHQDPEEGFQPVRPDALSAAQRAELEENSARKLSDEILTHVKNPFIGYAIVVDRNGIIQAHPEIDKFVGKQYVWPEGTTPLQADEDIKIQRAFFKGEPHYDFAAPVKIRDKNLGEARIGRVHLGLREDYIFSSLQAAKEKIVYITLLAILFGSAGAYFLAALIVKPIKGLVHDAEILGGGDLDHQVSISSHDEVGTLAETLDATRLKLKDARAKLITSERLARELEIAREIQTTLLPKETPTLERIEVGTLYRAASQVGGDLYDFFWVSEHELGVVVADVSGKGIPGSLVMTMAKAIIRAKAVKSDAEAHLQPVGAEGDPASVMRKANQMIFQDIKKGMFITANYSILDVTNLHFHFVSAGHNDTLLYNSRTDELREFNPKGIALGLDKGPLFDMLLQGQELTLSAGDLLFQFTDGINEAMNEQREEFGEERLKAAIKKYAHQSVNDFLQSLDQELRAFTAGFAQSDDITAVAVKVKV
jgi:serine phosphatase RsbU (regulator of sigma subunit)